MNAIIEDIRNGNLLVNRVDDEEVAIAIDQEMKTGSVYNGVLTMMVNEQYCYFNLNDKCEQVLKVLAELRVIESVDNPVVIGYE